MLILTLRTDKPEAEIGLYSDKKQLAYHKWLAHRQLAETLHTTISELLKDQNLEWKDVKAIACYKGPGSFTGLRIGLSVANALAYALEIPLIGRTGENWLGQAVDSLVAGDTDQVIVPEYGADVHITLPRSAPAA